ncbi:UbiA family prenyltransferase, partial [Streptomyces boncukensis]|uniref:UbiA family prenyltransferase n=1 Tax=Streptomyces boncukensis TaxID=2711219 RepID=UPI0030B9FC89
MSRGAAYAAAWAELLRVPAVCTVPGDALAGAAAAGRAPHRGTVLAAASSLCLYEAGMALNDWADRDTDAVERPERPLPSGRIAPPAALAAATGLTAAGLALAARAGRPALTCATALAATVWAYDLRLKHTPAGPAAMATARALDLLLGATAAPRSAERPASGERPAPCGAQGFAASSWCPEGRGALPMSGFAAGRDQLQSSRRLRRAERGSPDPARPAGPRSAGPRPAGPGSAGHGPAHRPGGALGAALTLAAHTYAVTLVSRDEAQGGTPRAPLAALGTVAAVTTLTARTNPLAAAAYAATAARGLV